MEVVLSFGLILFLILLNGVFVAAEFAIIGVRPSRIEQLAEEGNRVAIGLREVIRSPGKVDRYVATAQLGITLASLGLGMVGEPAVAHMIEAPLHDLFGLEGDIVHTISFFIALAIITYLHVVIGEMVPKSLALQNAERTVLLLSTPMLLTQRIFSFAITALNQIGLLTLRVLRVPPPEKGSRLHTPDELELIVSESMIAGMLEAQEQRLVANIFDFAELHISQVMVPRPRVKAFPITIEEKDLLKKILDSPHTRFPVYESDLDHIVGILHLKDLVRQQMGNEPFHLSSLLHQVPVVPEGMYAEDLLHILKQQKVHMAIVIDEYGGTAGIVTLEDLVEEVVGEVRDEFDTGELPHIVVIEPGHLAVQGSTGLHELIPYLNLGEHDYDVETIGGLLLANINLPPQVGDEAVINNIRLRAEEVKGLAVERVSIHYAPPGNVDKESTFH